MKNFFPFLTICLLAVFSASVNAQSSASDNITADATILDAITVTGVTNLDFGTFTATESSVIDIATDTPGKFTVTASSGADISVNFTDLLSGCVAYTFCLEKTVTPGDLTSDELEVTFGATDAGWDNDDAITNNPTNTFDPTVGISSLTTHDGAFAVFIAGTANASADQDSDTYQGTITLTVAYN